MASAVWMSMAAMADTPRTVSGDVHGRQSQDCVLSAEVSLVWTSPPAHSFSPALHTSILRWPYTRHQQGHELAGVFPTILESLEDRVGSCSQRTRPPKPGNKPRGEMLQNSQACHIVLKRSAGKDSDREPNIISGREGVGEPSQSTCEGQVSQGARTNYPHGRGGLN